MNKLIGPSYILKTAGTPAFTDFLTKIGDTPVKNWSGSAIVDFPQVEKIGGSAFIEHQQEIRLLSLCNCLWRAYEGWHWRIQVP